MKKLLTLLTMILIASMLLSCDMHNYTAEAPYICENGELTEEQARIMVDNGMYTYSFVSTDPVEIVRSGRVCVRVKKVSSTHYYWEENGEKAFYTDTTLQILEILSGTEKEYETYNVGDTVRILEYYSYEPNGNFISANGINANCRDINGNLTFLTEPIRALDGYANVYLSPFVKDDTEYILVLYEEYRIEHEEQKLKFGSVEIPFEKVQGIYFCKPLLVEFSQYAYDVAQIHLRNYENSLEEEFVGGSQIYDQRVMLLWKKYKERVNEG